MEELGTPMDRIFNAEKPRHSAECHCDYFYPLYSGNLTCQLITILKILHLLINCKMYTEWKKVSSFG